MKRRESEELFIIIDELRRSIIDLKAKIDFLIEKLDELERECAG